MRRLLYSLLILFSSPTILAQGEVAVDVAALQQLIEDQNRLLNDQSAQLKSLTRRVAALEGQTGVADEPPLSTPRQPMFDQTCRHRSTSAPRQSRRARSASSTRAN